MSIKVGVCIDSLYLVIFQLWGSGLKARLVIDIRVQRDWKHVISNDYRPCLGLSVNSYRLRSHMDTLETKRLQAFWSSWALCAADRLVAVLCFTAVSI